jgi:hypothetical protein
MTSPLALILCFAFPASASPPSQVKVVESGGRSASGACGNRLDLFPEVNAS